MRTARQLLEEEIKRLKMPIELVEEGISLTLVWDKKKVVIPSNEHARKLVNFLGNLMPSEWPEQVLSVFLDSLEMGWWGFSGKQESKHQENQ